jgi:hypothetical protein
MKYKVFIYACFLLIVSCSENDKSITPVNPDEQYLFEIKLNKIWMMAKGAAVASFSTINFDTSSWVIDYWDTTKQVKLPTYTIEWKEFDQGFPRYTDFGLALTDSSYIFGTKKHQFVSPTYPTDFFVFMFEIPKKMPSQQTKQNENIKVILNETLFWKYSYKIELKDSVSINGNKRKVWEIDYLAERKKPLPTIYGEEFHFAEKIGFYSFRNYILKNVTE